MAAKAGVEAESPDVVLQYATGLITQNGASARKRKGQHKADCKSEHGAAEQPQRRQWIPGQNDAETGLFLLYGDDLRGHADRQLDPDTYSQARRNAMTAFETQKPFRDGKALACSACWLSCKLCLYRLAFGAFSRRSRLAVCRSALCLLLVRS